MNVLLTLVNKLYLLTYLLSEHIDKANGLNLRKVDSSRCSVTDLDYDREIDCCDALRLSAQECDNRLCPCIGSPAVLDNTLGVGH